MTTTEDLPPLTTSGDVLSLSDRRQCPYLTGLLQQRAAFAGLTVQGESHFLADGGDRSLPVSARTAAVVTRAPSG